MTPLTKIMLTYAMMLKFTYEYMDNMKGIYTGLRLWVSPEIYTLLNNS